MDMALRALIPAERLYTDLQSWQITSQTGNIGYLTGRVEEDGRLATTTWNDRMEHLKMGEFKEELDAILAELMDNESCGRVLRNRATMAEYCRAVPESSFDEHDCKFGFRADTEQYAYLMRLTPTDRENNFTIFCYQRDWLDRHLKNAEYGIRFITSDYQELFRIPDGGNIIIHSYSGIDFERTCRFIDECHMEVGREIYHIAQFAEIQERNGNTVSPLYAPLPEWCFAVHPTSGEVICITRFKHGYEPCPNARHPGETARKAVNIINSANNITRAQEAAMFAGCTQGWNSRAADPRNYNSRGQPAKRKRKDRSDAR